MSRTIISTTAFVFGLALLGKGLYMPAKALLAQHLIAQAWSETLETGRATLPWQGMDAHPVAKLSFHQKDYIVLNSDSGQALAFGPGLITDTSLSGENMVAIAAHKNTQFSSLKALKQGDDIALKVDDITTHRYRVINHEVIDTRHQGLVHQDTAILALVTCYPFDAISFNGPLRYIVYAKKIDMAPKGST